VFQIRQITGWISLGILDLRVFAAGGTTVIKREIEKAGTQFLLSRMLGNDKVEIIYTNENKPQLKGRPEHISISHSHDKLAIIVNEKECTGVDIELIRDKVLRVTHKFLNDSELDWAGQNVERLIMLWGAKEALYKAYGLKGIDFREHLFIEEIKDNEITGSIRLPSYEKKYSMISEKLDNYILVYTRNEL
jgi:4'-phosphopantetheinyl transferase